MKILDVTAQCNETGTADEYENAMDRFSFFCGVEFEINGEDYRAAARFDCGYAHDVAEWENIDSTLLGVSDKQDDFINKCLLAAEKAMIKLKATL